MCRNIHTLHNFEPAANGDEIHAAALQYVRKISGTTKPSKANAEAFDRAVDEVAGRECGTSEELGRRRRRRAQRNGSLQSENRTGPKFESA